MGSKAKSIIMGKINNLFEEWNKQQKHNQHVNKLNEFNELIDWESFREELESMYSYKNGKGGRPSFDPVMMFKLLFLQRLYKLSDDEMEFQILDRRSFQKFLGIQEYERVPDSKTIWAFKERLREEKLDKVLFHKLEYWFKKQQVQVKGGYIIDATIIESPIQHITNEEKESLKQGEIPKEWKEKPHKKAQKDTDAKFVKKGERVYHGYKNHIIVNSETKIIETYEITPASTHDSVLAPEMLEQLKEGSEVYGDSAYISEDIKEVARRKKLNMKISKRNYRNKKLKTEEKEYNKEISKVRARVEHVFASMKAFGGKVFRRVGLERAEFEGFISNFTYNVVRIRFLLRKKLAC